MSPLLFDDMGLSVVELTDVHASGAVSVLTLHAHVHIGNPLVDHAAEPLALHNTGLSDRICIVQHIAVGAWTHPGRMGGDGLS